MGVEKFQAQAVWDLAARQHGVISRPQLLELGFGAGAIEHRIKRGRLHPLWRGVYAVGRPQVDRKGRWIAAVLACGPRALLSHRSAAELWGLLERSGPTVEIVLPARANRRRPGIRVHRRSGLEKGDASLRDGIPLTSPSVTLMDLAAAGDRWLDVAVNAADRLSLVDPEALRAEAAARPRYPGSARIRVMLDRQAYSPTDSVLERMFLSLVALAGLPRPSTQVELNGFRVDFYWPQFGLVAETDGLRYHRTAGQQATDLIRDQTHTAAGLKTLRFPAAQVRDDPATVQLVLRRTIASAAANAKD